MPAISKMDEKQKYKLGLFLFTGLFVVFVVLGLLAARENLRILAGISFLFAVVSGIAQFVVLGKLARRG